MNAALGEEAVLEEVFEEVSAALAVEIIDALAERSEGVVDFVERMLDRRRLRKNGGRSDADSDRPASECGGDQTDGGGELGEASTYGDTSDRTANDRRGGNRANGESEQYGVEDRL